MSEFVEWNCGIKISNIIHFYLWVWSFVTFSFGEFERASSISDFSTQVSRETRTQEASCLRFFTDIEARVDIGILVAATELATEIFSESEMQVTSSDFSTALLVSIFNFFATALSFFMLIESSSFGSNISLD